MRYMYTTEPDKLCHAINGVMGRPVGTLEQKTLKTKGWVFDASKLAKKESGGSKAEAKEATKEKDGVLTRNEKAAKYGIKITDDKGNKIHYKLLDGLIEQAQADEHNERHASE